MNPFVNSPELPMFTRLQSLIRRSLAAVAAVLTTDTGLHATDEWGGMDWFIL